MECPTCHNLLKEGAKFCGKCGTKIEQSSGNDENKPGKTCSSCGNILKPDAKFCGKCGTPQESSPGNSSNQQAENPTKGYIMWEMQPGQIALRLTESNFSQYGKANGVVIPEGYLAMVMCGGKLQSTLEAGIYKFDKKVPDDGNAVSRIASFFTNLFGGRQKNSAQNQKDSDAVVQSVQKRVPVEIVVCRSVNFSLPFTFKNIATSTVRVDVGLLLSMQVSNLMELYKRYLLDRTVLASETFASELAVYLEDAVKECLLAVAPEKVSLNGELKSALGSKLKDIFTRIFPYIEYLDIVKIDTGREELQRLERLSEEMYLSERELEQLSRRNEFMNRLSQEQNSAELQNAANATEFNRRLAEINRDNLLNEEEMANLQRDIQERSENHEFDRARAMEMMVLQHQHDVRDAQIKMEEELGTRLFNIQRERQQQMDDYADVRRRKELELDKEEQLGQLDLLKQAQDIRQQREQAEHNRKLEEKRQDQTHEMDKLHVYTSMSAEQIMVANPNITPDAAKAMAEKFKAEAAVAANDSRAENAMEQTRMMKEFMEQQMQAVRDMASANAQAMSGMMNAKEREIERTQHIMDKNEDRYASMVREQIKSGGNSTRKVCSKCGSDTGEEIFCPECGARIS